MTSPWSVRSLDDFRYYCCPECEIKHVSEHGFVQHAFELHPGSYEFIKSFVQDGQVPMDHLEQVKEHTGN